MPFTNSSVILQTLFFVVNQSQVPTEEYSNNNYYINIGKDLNITKCYGSFGCFNLHPPWTSEHRPVSLFPEDSYKIEPHFPYMTRDNYEVPLPELDLNDFDVIGTSDINPNVPLYLITHGFMEAGNRPWLQEMAYEFLDKEDCTVIIIDWGRGSGPPYTQAVANIRLVGVMTAHLLAEFAKYTGKRKLDHVHCVGHSLGAHLCGYVGYNLQKDFELTLGRITGMDPAEPHFAKAQPPVRLDRSAAHYVDVIHTDASAFIRGGLGIVDPIGHVDYFPNGGTNQPGCGRSVVEYITSEQGSFIKGIRLYLGCNHLRSHEYFIASINPRCRSFTSIACDSYEDFKEGNCFKCGKNGRPCITFGYHGRKDYQRLLKEKVIRSNESAVQYLLTGNLKPYCKSHYHISVTISDSQESQQHGGEIGQILLRMHGYDKDDLSSDKVPLEDVGYHGPGSVHTAVIAADEVPQIKYVEVEWKYHSSMFNPLTWRIFASPRIFVTEVTVRVLETQQFIRVCPKDNKPLISGIEQNFLPSYCTT